MEIIIVQYKTQILNLRFFLVWFSKNSVTQEALT